LFKAYVDSLRRNGKRSAYDAERILSAMAGAIGPDRPANSIKRGDLVPHLHAVYQRGSAMAEKVRAYLSAAFAFGMRAEGDITLATTTNRWRIEANPVAGIGAVAGAKRAGNRFLSPVEVRIFWLWLLEYSAQCRLASAVLLKIATGQRSEEILRINDAGYYRAAGMLIWETTKTGVPHSIPLPRQAVAILNDLCPNAHGLFFPSIGRPERCAAYNGVGQVIKKFLRLHPGFPHFTARDLRRSWKTLAGAAGISKEWRDKLQNHAGGDVSSKHYDRYDYLDEKREAMARWSDYLDAVIDGTIDQVGMRGSNVVQLAPSASAAP
jgi:integrase